MVFGILVNLVARFSIWFLRRAHLALQNVNKNYVIFLYFRNLVAKRCCTSTTAHNAPLPKIIFSDSTSIIKKSKYSLEKLPGNYEKKFSGTVCRNSYKMLV